MEKTQIKSESKREKIAAGLSIVVALILSLLKLGGFKLTGSHALLADSVHSLTDSISSVLVLLGLYLSDIKTKKFPYGLYKLENVVSLLLSFFIIGSGFEILKKAIGSSALLKYRTDGLIIAGFSVLLSLILGFYKLYISGKTGSPSLKSDGIHSLSDALSSVVVFTGIFLSKTHPATDNISGIIVVVLLFFAGGEIFIQSLKVLLDASLPESDMTKIIAVLAKFPDVEVKTIKGRRSGKYAFVELSLVIKERLYRKAHVITEEIEHAIKNRLKGIESITIHYEPSEESNVIAIPFFESGFAGKIIEASHFCLFNEKGKPLRKIENEAVLLERGKGVTMVKELLKNSVDIIVVPGMLEATGISAIIDQLFEVKADSSLYKKFIKKCR